MLYFCLYRVTTYLLKNLPLQHKSGKRILYMKIRFYQIAIHYRNKIHDFHAWGAAAQI